MGDETKGVIGLVAIVIIVLVVVVSFFQRDDPNNKWGSKYGNENVRQAIRDEMIRNGTDPLMAETYTKMKYEEERQKNR